MAKRRRRRRSRRGVGAVVKAGRRSRRRGRRGLRGLGPAMKTLMPVGIGAGVAAATIGGVRHFVQPGAGTMQAQLYKHAPWVGVGAGALAAGLLYVMRKDRAGAFVTVGASVFTGLTAFMMDQLLKAHPETPAGLAGYGFGAVVPEYPGMMGLPSGGTGAIVMEPARQMAGYGEEVNLGAINAGAFGTPGFSF